MAKESTKTKSKSKSKTKSVIYLFIYMSYLNDNCFYQVPVNSAVLFHKLAMAMILEMLKMEQIVIRWMMVYLRINASMACVR